MKKHIYIFFLVFTTILNSQNSFVPKEVNSEKLKTEYVESNYKLNVIQTYLKRNYKATSKMTDVEKFVSQVCGFTQTFEPKISYTLDNCEEGKGWSETIIFPKTKLEHIKKWVQQIYKTQPMDLKNIWYKGTTEYGPERKEEGCYYQVFQNKDNSTIEIWCGS